MTHGNTVSENTTADTKDGAASARPGTHMTASARSVQFSTIILSQAEELLGGDVALAQPEQKESNEGGENEPMRVFTCSVMIEGVFCACKSQRN